MFTHMSSTEAKELKDIVFANLALVENRIDKLHVALGEGKVQNVGVKRMETLAMAEHIFSLRHLVQALNLSPSISESVKRSAICHFTRVNEKALFILSHQVNDNEFDSSNTESEERKTRRKKVAKTLENKVKCKNKDEVNDGIIYVDAEDAGKILSEHGKKPTFH